MGISAQVSPRAAARFACPLIVPLTDRQRQCRLLWTFVQTVNVTGQWHVQASLGRRDDATDVATIAASRPAPNNSAERRTRMKCTPQKNSPG